MHSAHELGPLMEIVSGMGLEVTYEYEDMAFISHNAFLVVLPPVGKPKHFKLYFNKDVNKEAMPAICTEFERLAAPLGCSCEYVGHYSLRPASDGMLDVEMFDEMVAV